MSGVAQVLRDALARLDGGKRWRGRATAGPEFWCASNAIAAEVRAGATPEIRMAPQHALGEVIHAEYPDRAAISDSPLSIFAFNDHPDTTWADVERVFEKAIANAEAEL